MAIDFTFERWEKIREDADGWWSGDLKRPLIQMRLVGKDPGRGQPNLARVPRTAFYPFDTPASEIVDRWDFDLSSMKYLGDAFPAVIPDFGPGVIAAFLGAETVVENDTVWFKPVEPVGLDRIAFEFDDQNDWFLRVQDLFNAGLEQWEGLVQLGMTDLGGNLDILSTFRPGEALLVDLYDSPEQVKCLTWEAHEMWWRYFDRFNRLLQSVNPGYTAWTHIFSDHPYYMLQCDFCYMIGPDMFDEFVKPELEATCKRLSNPFYHLDGPGQLPHLDSLLQIETLKGVQWIPGAGQPDYTHWPEVYRKIRDAGKRIQFSGTMDMFEKVAAQLGSAEGIVFMGHADISDEPAVLEFLRKYDVI